MLEIPWMPHLWFCYKVYMLLLAHPFFHTSNILDDCLIQFYPAIQHWSAFSPCLVTICRCLHAICYFIKIFTWVITYIYKYSMLLLGNPILTFNISYYSYLYNIIMSIGAKGALLGSPQIASLGTGSFKSMMQMVTTYEIQCISF